LLIERDYVELFHIAVKTLRQDYIGSREKMVLYNPNPYTNKMTRAMFDGVDFDSVFITNMNAYLAGFKDKQLRLHINSEHTYYQPFSRGYYVRRCLDGLFVTLASQSKKFQVGDQIIRLSEFSVPMLVKMFGPAFYGDIPEREFWSGVLKAYETCRVRHKDGSEETLEQEKFFTPEEWSNRVDNPEPGTIRLQLEDFSKGNSIPEILSGHHSLICNCKKLIIDVRHTQGLDEESVIALLPYIFQTPVTPAQILVSPDMKTKFTRNNCDLLIRRLRNLVPSTEDAPDWIGEMINELDARAGNGIQPDPEEIPEGWDEPLKSYRKNYQVVFITDTFCRGVAELLAARCREAGVATLIGRPTLGDLGYCHPVTISLDNTFSLTYPISRNTDGERYATRGVPVDEYIPFTTGEFQRDILLKKALDY
jgi:hypothetical protein